MTNQSPWASRQVSGSSSAPVPVAPSVSASPPALTPQLGLTPPDRADQLPLRQVGHSTTAWVVGAHGGAGETTLATLLRLPGAGRSWPVAAGNPLPVLLVARTHASGLLRAQAALRHWAAGAPVNLVGLVLIADAPGRLPRPLRDLRQHVAAGAPRFWSLPWVESWRQGGDPDPSVARSTLREISALIEGELHA